MKAMDFSAVKEQFSGLNMNDPGTWPVLPQLVFSAGIAIAVVVMAWFFMISPQRDILLTDANKEVHLKQVFLERAQEASSLPLLLIQKAQAEAYVLTLERQLPNAAQMDALLSDINAAGIGRGLAFKLFKPQNVMVKSLYAELPIEIKVTGTYNAMAQFMTDIAHLSRIVTLSDLHIQESAPSPVATKPGASPGLTGSPELTMTALVHTFRYLSQSEVDAMEKPVKKGAK